MVLMQSSLIMYSILLCVYIRLEFLIIEGLKNNVCLPNFSFVLLLYVPMFVGWSLEKWSSNDDNETSTFCLLLFKN